MVSINAAAIDVSNVAKANESLPFLPLIRLSGKTLEGRVLSATDNFFVKLSAAAVFGLSFTAAGGTIPFAGLAGGLDGLTGVFALVVGFGTGFTVGGFFKLSPTPFRESAAAGFGFGFGFLRRLAYKSPVNETVKRTNKKNIIKRLIIPFSRGF
jgi:hypothetical protein